MTRASRSSGTSKEQLKREKLELLEAKLKRVEQLPHLYELKPYQWQKEFIASQNKMNILTAANQIGKSSVQIMKAIKWATSPELWSELWPLRRPRQFWYLYPTNDISTIEFHEKWVPDFLPREEMKDDPVFGWTAEYVRKQIHFIRFNSGVTIYFKTYGQQASALQAGTVDAIFTDEELPAALYDELRIRLIATEGYFHMVFTATLNQHLWKMAMEPDYRETELEKFPQAAKWQISLFDCQFYADGSVSNWSKERIESVVASCSSEQEVLRRVYGRFVTEEGLMYPNFDAKNNTIAPWELDGSWLVYCGIDYGSGGGGKNHPASIVFVAVDPEFKSSIVFKCWRGDTITTTAETILEKYVELRKPFKRQVVATYYDYHCKDMLTISYGMKDVALLSANKKRDEGQQVMNSLFKAEALQICRNPEGEKLVYELENLLQNTDKRNAMDDLIDSLRYTVVGIPYDWARIKKPETRGRPKKVETEVQQRRSQFLDETKQVSDDISNELSLWNDLLGEF